MSVKPASILRRRSSWATALLGMIIIGVSAFVIVRVSASTVPPPAQYVVSAPGVVYPSVVAEPGAVPCGISGGSLPSHTVNAGGHTWQALDSSSGLETGVSYRGELRIVAAGTGRTDAPTDGSRAELSVGDRRVTLSGYPATCE